MWEMLQAGGAGRGTSTASGTRGWKSVFEWTPGVPEQRCLLGGASIQAVWASLGGSSAGLVPVWDGWQHSRGWARARAGARGGARAHRPIPEQPDRRGWFEEIGPRAGLNLLPCSLPYGERQATETHMGTALSRGDFSAKEEVVSK